MPDLPPTSPEEAKAPRLRRARMGRRVALGILSAFVLCGAIGLFGIRTRTTTATGGGFALTLSYPFTDRSDQPIHWVLLVRHAGGFTGPIDVGITQSYLDLLDFNDIEPAPSDARTDGSFVVWTFSPPRGNVLRISIDAQISLNAHFGAGATVAVFEGGTPVVKLPYRTWVAP
jgi:hypothetical protein